MLPFLDGARANGDETLVVGPPALADMVAGTGHRFTAGGEPPEEAIAPIREQLPVAPAHEASVLGNRELFGRLATTAMLPAMEAVASDWQPDLVLRDPCEYASAIVATGFDIPAAQVAIGLAEVEWGSVDVAAPALEEHRTGLVDDIRRSPYLSRFPASMDTSPFVDTRRFREASGDSRGIDDWWNGSRAPLVYASFGTVLGHMSVAAGVYETIFRAVQSIDARVLLTVGRHFDRSRLGPVPGNVHVEAWVDQADVFAEADLVVCHGGSGTSFGALAAGLPLVVVPVFADQFTNAGRIAECGAGIAVDTGRRPDGSREPLSAADAPRITKAIEAVRADAVYRERARGIAVEMAGVPTARSVLDDLLPR
jgi:UDP:flavonoid glycosyltransferase YjiC (YdhE family)